MNKNQIVVKQIQSNSPNIFSAFTNGTLVFPDEGNKKEYNASLSDAINNWAITWNERPKSVEQFDVFIVTLLERCDKRYGEDVENLLLYNLNSKTNINKIITNSNKIIIQCLDGLCHKWSTSIFCPYCYYYFYGVFDNNYQKYLLYNYPKNNNFYKLAIVDYNKLKNSKRGRKKQKLNEVVSNYSESQNPVVPKGTKFCMYIKAPKKLWSSIDNLKHLIDYVIAFANALNIIEHPDPNKIVNKNGFNPNDDMLYFCEIEKTDNSNNDIEFSVCPICTIANNPCRFLKHENLKNYPEFENVSFNKDELEEYIKIFSGEMVKEY